MSSTGLDPRKRYLVKRLLETTDDRLIGLVEEILSEKEGYIFSEPEIKEFEEQLPEYLRGDGASYSWEEVRSAVAARRKGA